MSTPFDPPPAPNIPKASTTVRLLPQAEDPYIVEVRDILLGCSTMGFSSVIVVGMHARGAGVSLACSSHLDALRTVGALELAQSDLLMQMRMGPRRSPPMGPSTPPPGGAPDEPRKET